MNHITRGHTSKKKKKKKTIVKMKLKMETSCSLYTTCFMFCPSVSLFVFEVQWDDDGCSKFEKMRIWLHLIWHVACRWRYTPAHHQGSPALQEPSGGLSQVWCLEHSWLLLLPYLRPAPLWTPWGCTHTTASAGAKKETWNQWDCCLKIHFNMTLIFYNTNALWCTVFSISKHSLFNHVFFSPCPWGSWH